MNRSSMSSLLNCFKNFNLRSRKQPRLSQKHQIKTLDARSPAKSIQISNQAPATPPNDEVIAEINGVGGAEVVKGADVTATAYTAELVKEPAIEGSKASTAAGKLLHEDDLERAFVISESDTNAVPKILGRQATLNVSADAMTNIPFPSNGSLTPTLSRDNSQNSQSSLRSRADSKGSSTQAHWLKEQLEKAELECPKHHHNSLIPRNALEELINFSHVKTDMQSRDPDLGDAEAAHYAEEVCRRARRLYATLAYTKKGAEIQALLDEGVTDDDLPFAKINNGKSKFALVRKNGGTINCLGSWTCKQLKKFDQHQWWVSAPVFKLNEELYELDDKTILPFVLFEMPKGVETKKQGGYSEVYPVRIHPAHHEFWPSSGCVDDEPLIAVKQLFSDDENEFLKEKTILTAMTMKNHPHLIKLLATYKYDGKYHLMFPFANANLRKYWDDRPNPPFNHQTVMWSVKQMTGIAHGLLRIHNFNVTRPLSIKGPGNARVQKNTKLSVQEGEEWFGRHGDIKPENVLWFAEDRETNGSGGILQIADFGLGRFHGRDSRSRVNPDSVFSSPTYEPPECHLRLPVSRAYDMWSLGCLYLEFVTWLLKGSAEIDGFSEFRGREATGTGINDDNFFTIINDDEGQRATVREKVVTWTENLHAHEKCSPLIHDLIHLTMDGLLVVDSSKRYPASWLCIKLDECFAKAQKDRDYVLKPDPRSIRPEAQDRANSIPGSTKYPRQHANTNPTRTPHVKFADSKEEIKHNLQQTLPRDLLLRKSGIHTKTWPTHGPEIPHLPR